MTKTSTLPGQDLVADIESALRQYAEFGDGCPDGLAKAVRYSLLAPGKRLRPILVLLAARACGAAWSRAMPAACAVEMIHTYSLIHDDLPAMDDDDVRRGMPTCHIQFGEATAILAGDALQPRAFEILATDIRPAEVANACCRELARTAGATQLVGGQADDLAAEGLDADANLLDAIHRRKTGAMFVTSVRLGGLVGQATEEELRALSTYGAKIGLAFQIVDDLLDATGEEAALGKRTQKDAKRGKTTYPAIHGIPASRQKADELVHEACKALTPFRQALAGTSLAEDNSTRRNRSAESAAAANAMTERQIGVAELETLARYIVGRTH